MRKQVKDFQIKSIFLFYKITIKNILQLNKLDNGCDAFISVVFSKISLI